MINKYISIFFIILGISLLITWGTFYLLKYPDITLGYITGPLCIVIGLGFLDNKKKSVVISERNKLSSNLTKFYKYGTPIIYLIILVGIIIFFGFIETNMEARIFGLFFGLFVLFGAIWIVIIFRKLVFLEYDNNYLYINKINMIKLKDITNIKVLIPPIYKIEIKGDIYYFFPSFFEQFNIGKSESISKLILHIEKLKRSTD